jgi:hypothetical protein
MERYEIKFTKGCPPDAYIGDILRERGEIYHHNSSSEKNILGFQLDPAKLERLQKAFGNVKIIQDKAKIGEISDLPESIVQGLHRFTVRYAKRGKDDKSGGHIADYLRNNGFKNTRFSNEFGLVVFQSESASLDGIVEKLETGFDQIYQIDENFPPEDPNNSRVILERSVVVI